MRQLIKFLATIIVFWFIYDLVGFEYRVHNGYHEKFLWVERNIPKGYPDTVWSTKTKIDTFYKNAPLHISNKSENPTIIQKNDSGASGVQAGLITGGNVAGRDFIINNNTATISDKTLDSIVSVVERLRQENNISGKVVKVYIGPGGDGSSAIKIINYLKAKKYQTNSNPIPIIDGSSGYHVTVFYEPVRNNNAELTTVKYITITVNGI